MKKVIGFLAVFVILYMGLYVLLSFNGEYEATNVLKGKVEWQPAGCNLRRVKPWGEEEKWEADFGGYFFFPLIYVDRGLWHKNKPMSQHMWDKAKEPFQEEK